MTGCAVRTFPKLAMLLVALTTLSRAVAMAQDKPEVPEINGMAGSCSAAFTVTDAAKKPVYNAKIEVVIRYGFGGMRKSDLQIGTDSDGKARVKGLPEKVKKPLEFRISSGSLSKTVLHDPSTKCDASVEVALGIP